MAAFSDRMPFPGIDHELMLDTELAERAVEVHRLAHRHVSVLLAVHEQHRGADLRRVGDRAELLVTERSAALPAAAAAEPGLLPA